MGGVRKSTPILAKIKYRKSQYNAVVTLLWVADDIEEDDQ
jgi:hypothetical protein